MASHLDVEQRERAATEPDSTMAAVAPRPDSAAPPSSPFALSELTPQQLAEAFQAFETASAVMSRQYESLRCHIAELDLELAAKNKQLRETLCEREAFSGYLESLLENLTDGVVAVSSERRVVTVNRAAEQMIGLSREQLIDEEVERTLPFVSAAFGSAEWTSADSGFSDSEPLTVSWTNAEGRAKTFEIQLRRISTLPRAQGRDTAPETSPGSVENQGPPDGLLIMRDVTELRRLERAAVLRNRLTAMGEMAMNVAHEVRNPLGSIELFASALRQEIEDAPEPRRLVDFISQGVRDIDNIVGNILMFARQMAPSLKGVDPEELLDDVLTYARFHMEQKDITLSRRSETGALQCLGDIELLKQVFLNLLLNATQAMEPGGALQLEANAQNGHIVFTVADNGPGIDPETLGKIFDPFYTTKRRGTGLGLTICHNIIQAHQGTIEVESDIGGGTRFTVRIPRA